MQRIKFAVLAAELGTCKRRKIGAAAFDSSGVLLGTAANGRPTSLGSCLEFPCPGADVPAGYGNADCRGIHAEERLFMSIPKGQIHSLYSTKAPCVTCTLKAIEHGVMEIFFIIESNETANAEIAMSAGIKFEKVNYATD